ncbi:MAG: sugar ABC transporter ATP-binding protein, partial [Verrucomicrobia bacterium]|nr:sugar ABC transporter ATP-binding protein [Verrucomicrobiota bacterium]
MSTPTIELVDIQKAFGSTRVLDGVSLSLMPGEVHSLVGENGAGKSTLVKIMAGVHLPDGGIVKMNGRDVFLRSTAQAQQAGVSVIYQEPSLFRDLSVAENVYMHRQPKTAYGWIDYAAMHRSVAQHLNQLGVSLRPDDPVLGLSIADQQMVEIIKALTFEAKVLIMDEPTAALSVEEVKRLFQVVERLRAKGVALLFVSHRLEEVFAISQRITVMRDGKVVGSGVIADWTTQEVIRKMVGRSLDALYPKEEAELGDIVLRVRDLRRAGVFRDISFDVRRGEIVALAGLVGAGRSEVARSIFGIDPLDSGVVTLGETTLANHTPEIAIKAGIGFVPEDRQQQGLVMEMTTLRNATLTILGQLQHFGLVSRRKERATAANWTQRMQLKGHIDEPV